MPKFPSEVEGAITVGVPVADAYAFVWDAPASSRCLPGLDRCERVADDTFRYVFAPRSIGPLSLVVRYTATFRGNGTDEISFESVDVEGDNTEVRGAIRFARAGEGVTRITAQQMTAPDSPVPRLLQGLVRGFVDAETKAGLDAYLGRLKQALEGRRG